MPMWNSGSLRSSMWPPRSSLRVLHCSPRGLALLGAALRGGRVAPTFVTACSSLPPKGAAAPAARLSRFRGPCLTGPVPALVGSLAALTCRYGIL